MPRNIPTPGEPMASLKPVTLVDQIAEAIVRGAAEGRFRPGDRVVEAEIARELDVSRVPVREALRLLESQGIVVNTPYRGMRLMEVTVEHLEKILVVRSSLERIAAPTAAAAISRDDSLVGPLTSILAIIRDGAAAGDRFTVVSNDTAFHRVICQMSGNEVLVQMWEMLARKLTIFFGLAATNKPLELFYGDHLELLEVLKRGRPGEIDRVFDQHTMSALHEIDFDMLTTRTSGR